MFIQTDSRPQCACGCGAEIAPYDPSPDFKYIQCNLLWLASVDKPDPAWWRANQRYVYRLVALESRWQDCYWEYEMDERLVKLHGLSAHGEPVFTYEDALANLIQRWVRYLRTPAPEFDMPVAHAES